MVKQISDLEIFKRFDALTELLQGDYAKELNQRLGETTCEFAKSVLAPIARDAGIEGALYFSYASSYLARPEKNKERILSHAVAISSHDAACSHFNSVIEVWQDTQREDPWAFTMHSVVGVPYPEKDGDRRKVFHRVSVGDVRGPRLNCPSPDDLVAFVDEAAKELDGRRRLPGTKDQIRTYQKYLKKLLGAEYGIVAIPVGDIYSRTVLGSIMLLVIKGTSVKPETIDALQREALVLCSALDRIEAKHIREADVRRRAITALDHELTLFSAHLQRLNAEGAKSDLAKSDLMQALEAMPEVLNPLAFEGRDEHRPMEEHVRIAVRLVSSRWHPLEPPEIEDKTAWPKWELRKSFTFAVMELLNNAYRHRDTVREHEFRCSLEGQSDRFVIRSGPQRKSGLGHIGAEYDSRGLTLTTQLLNEMNLELIPVVEKDEYLVLTVREAAKRA